MVMYYLRYSTQLTTRLEGKEEASWKPRSPEGGEALAGLAEVLHLHIPRVGAELTRPRLQDGTGHALPEVGGADDWGGVVFCGGVVHVVLHHVIILVEEMGNRKAYLDALGKYGILWALPVVLREGHHPGASVRTKGFEHQSIVLIVKHRDGIHRRGMEDADLVDDVLDALGFLGEDVDLLRAEDSCVCVIHHVIILTDVVGNCKDYLIWASTA